MRAKRTIEIRNSSPSQHLLIGVCLFHIHCCGSPLLLRLSSIPSGLHVNHFLPELGMIIPFVRVLPSSPIIATAVNRHLEVCHGEATPTTGWWDNST